MDIVLRITAIKGAATWLDCGCGQMACRQLVELTIRVQTKVQIEAQLAQGPTTASPCGLARWATPATPWVKLNTYGAHSVIGGHTSCGGVARDSSGQWLFGFTKFIGICLVLDEEV
ncbi:hypothetical protein V6N13_064069 [Hibiscus sabdariffa]